jgi:hypothetical protein
VADVGFPAASSTLRIANSPRRTGYTLDCGEPVELPRDLTHDVGQPDSDRDGSDPLRGSVVIGVVHEDGDLHAVADLELAEQARDVSFDGIGHVARRTGWLPDRPAG